MIRTSPLSRPLAVPKPCPAQRATASALFAALLLAPGIASAQTRGAELLREQKPAYPEALHQSLAQGNTIVIARIDVTGKVRDPRAVWSTHEPFASASLAALQGWSFRPAVRDGRPVEIAANIVFPFRINDDKGKAAGRPLMTPALRELAIFPADAGGKRTAPEGFPVRRGGDPGLRVEAALDVPGKTAARGIAVRVEAISPTGRRVVVHESQPSVPPNATNLKVSFTAAVGTDWEDGIWMLRFTADKAEAGRGQFWLAGDPAKFDFAGALKRK